MGCRFLLTILFLAGLSSATGCGGHWLSPLANRQVAVPSPQAIENPLFVPVPDAEFVFNQVVDEVDDYFKIEREQRVHEAGGLLMEGRVDTYPMVASSLLEPWRRDSTPGFEKLHSSLQSSRRRATVRVIPRQGGYLLDVQVVKELEDLNSPQIATQGGLTPRHDNALLRNDREEDEERVTLGWITLGRDVSLEQQMLAELRARLTKVGPPPKHHGPDSWWNKLHAN